MANVEGFRRIGIFLGGLLSLIWTILAIFVAVLEGFSLNLDGFGMKNILSVWAGGLLVTYLVPRGLMAGLGWIVEGFQKGRGEGG